MSLVSARHYTITSVSAVRDLWCNPTKPVIGETWGEMPPSRSTSASWSDVLRNTVMSGIRIVILTLQPTHLSSNKVSPPNIAPRKRPSGFNA